jgi:hypothetical protein
MYRIVLRDDLPVDAAAFAALLKDQGVMARPLSLGMHERPASARARVA